MFTQQFLALLASTTLALAAAGDASGSISVTPHDSYSSSVGFLGCYLDTNRVAYWPDAVGCDNLCVNVTYQSRSVTLLRIDQSGGAHDISYDAWNYLATGQSAMDDPMTGGEVVATYETVAMAECQSLITTSSGKLAITAANGMNYVAACAFGNATTWVGQNYELRNINTPTCTYGYDELCSLNMTASNQPSCPHELGDPVVLDSPSVTNIAYGTSNQVKAV